MPDRTVYLTKLTLAEHAARELGYTHITRVFERMRKVEESRLRAAIKPKDNHNQLLGQDVQ